MSEKTQKQFGAAGLVLLAIAFIAAVILSDRLLGGLQIDLTENGLYTLSDGTERILGSIDEPINLYFYYSDEATAGIPQLRDYADRVREMLEEFRDRSDGNIRLEVIDPVPFSEEEDRAAQFGLEAVQLGAAPDPVYMGLAGTNGIGDEEIIPFFHPDEEPSLEYELAKLVSSLASPEKSVVGLVSGLPLAGGFDPATQRPQAPWVVYEQARQLFEIRDLGTDFDTVPDDVGLLWIVQPRDIAVETQYAIDQFVMAGGKALIFVDPMAAIDAAPMQGAPQGMPPMGQGSDLPQLFAGWGIEFTASEVVADAQLALQISTGFGGRPVRHYGYLGLGASNLSDADIVTQEVGSVNVAMAGAVGTSADGSAESEPLLESTAASMLLPASRFSFLPDPAALQDGFVPDGEKRVLAARITGVLASAFPDGPPGTAEEPEEPAETDASRAHLAESAGPVNLIIVGDVDMLGDSLWVQVQNFFGQQIASAFAGNGAFVVNALENLAGSADLISVRSRGSYARPFTRVDELQAEAEARYRETEESLQQELADTERRLAELQASREDTGSLLLSDEQQAEIDRFVDRRAEIRSELRAVQRGLDEDIDSLGTWLRVINIGLVPLLLTLVTLVAVWHRRQRREAA